MYALLEKLRNIEGSVYLEVPMPVNELERFLTTWDREASNTAKLLRALPASQ